MAKLSAYNFISLNGYYKGADGDISWHRHGAEENQYAADSLNAGNILVFGRVTYQIMASYWPTPMAIQNDPTVAQGMNKAEKLVFSRTLKMTEWENSEIINGDMFTEISKRKKDSSKDMTILGSGSIITQLAERNLIDEYQIMIDPVIISSGTAIFQGLEKRMDLHLKASRKFSSGVVLLSYETETA